MAHYKGAAAEATRAMHLLKKRERAAEELEIKKRKIEENLKISTIDNKFSTQTKEKSSDPNIRATNSGLVTLDQLRERHEIANKERDRQLARQEQSLNSQQSSSQLMQTKLALSGEVKKKKILPIDNKKLSFGYDSDEDDEEEDDKEEQQDDDEKLCNIKPSTQSSVENNHDDESNLTPDTKCAPIRSTPKLDVDTSLLPDCEREEEERKLREKLAAEWREEQQRLKGEAIEITFSFWDGSGHRRQVTMKKGDSIYQFLQACLENLRKDFNELRKVSADQMMYVKEDLIIPHHYTFYDFIVTKARGKSGPLFSFDVHDDIRLMGDARVEKDESHAGKVLLRSWYERNKHIFPASRWEPYDPAKSYSKYTISDKRSK